MAGGDPVVINVTALAIALNGARRVRMGLPIAIVGRILLSIFAIKAGDAGGAFDLLSWASIVTAVAAALVIVGFDSAMIRARAMLRGTLQLFIMVACLATLVDMARAAVIVRDALAGGGGIAALQALDDKEEFVGFVGLGFWLILPIAIVSWRLLDLPLSAKDQRHLTAARAAWPEFGMGLRWLLTVVLTVVAVGLLLLTVGLLRNIPFYDVVAEINRLGIARITADLMSGLMRGQTAAIGVLVVFVIGVVVLILALHSRVAPHQSLLNRLWRWAMSARAALSRDRRAPVLLLRSFADEALTTSERAGDFGKGVEDSIARVVGGRGPFIAIGIPGEPAPSGTAYRVYLDDSAWQATVVEWMEASQLVTIVLGQTRHVKWELEALRDRGLMTKVRALLPPTGDANREARWAMLMDCCERTPWLPALAAIADRRRVLLVAFEEEGRVRTIESQRLSRDDYHAAMLAGLGVVQAPAMAKPS